MRITAGKKEETRRRILRSARNLFRDKGFTETTTRDIALAAEVAVGTVFNYFPTKEAVALALMAKALRQADAEFDRWRNDESRGAAPPFLELLFAHIAVGLRHLRPYRVYVAEVFESTLSPFTKGRSCEAAERIRVGHLETVRGLIAGRSDGGPSEPNVVTMHLYWTLYLGVLAYWSADESPNQEESLALLDQTMRLFVTSLSGGRVHQEVSGGA